MSATTVKIEDPLLQEIRHVKGSNMSVSAFVQEVLRKEIERRHMLESATVYQKFLNEHPVEAEDMEVWESAPLDSDYRKNEPRKKKP